MKIHNFIKLPENEQFDCIWSLGTHVDTFIKGDVSIYLYIISDFYCEVHHSSEKNKFLFNKCFKQGKLLDKYLNRIEL